MDTRTFDKQRVFAAFVLLLVAIASFSGAPLLAPEWQDGSRQSRAVLLLNLEALGPFLIVPVALILLVLAGLVRPAIAQRRAVVVGLYFATVMAATYVLILAYATTGATLLAVPGVAAVYAVGRVAAGVLTAPRHRWLCIGVICALYLLVSLVSGELTPPLELLVGALVFCMLCAGPLLFVAAGVWLIYQAPRSRIPRPAWIAPIFTYVATWRFGVVRSIEMYNALPATAPDCYVATAAAAGHRDVVGSEVSASGVFVNRQLRAFKMGELVLASKTPWLHRQVRSGYDQIGPRLARRLRNPWLGDLAYILLLPLEGVARLFTLIVPRPHRSRLTNELYR